MGGANQQISAGLGGFLTLFVIAIVLWLLMRNMSGRLRTVRFEEEAEDERRAAEAGADVTVRPSRRRIFLPVDPDMRPTFAEDGPASAYGPGTRREVGDASGGPTGTDDVRGAGPGEPGGAQADPRS